MAKNTSEITSTAADTFPINEIIESNPNFTRREALDYQPGDILEFDNEDKGKIGC